MNIEEHEKRAVAKKDEQSQKLGITLERKVPKIIKDIIDCVLVDSYGNILAVAECKYSFNANSINRAMHSILRCFSKMPQLRFGIIFQEEDQCVVAEKRGDNSVISFPVESFENALLYIIDRDGKQIKNNRERHENNGIEPIIKILLDSFCGLNRHLDSYLNKLGVKDFCIDGNTISLSTQKEEEFFENLLWADRRRVTSLTKYCSKNALFRMLNEKKQSMTSIVNMNDKSECDYADKLLDNANYKWSEIDKEQTTNIFLMSMVDGKRNDELTPWRLYGDGSKGVSITYHNVKAQEGIFMLPLFITLKMTGRINCYLLSKIYYLHALALYSEIGAFGNISSNQATMK